MIEDFLTTALGISIYFLMKSFFTKKDIGVHFFVFLLLLIVFVVLRAN